MSDVTPQASGAAAQAAAVPHSRLAHFPVTFFASVMGLAGLALALHRAELSFGWAHWASHAALWAAVADFLMIAVFFALKALREPKAFMGEWHHPVKLAFFPAISISILPQQAFSSGDGDASAAPSQRPSAQTETNHKPRLGHRLDVER